MPGTDAADTFDEAIVVDGKDDCTEVDVEVGVVLLDVLFGV